MTCVESWTGSPGLVPTSVIWEPSLYDLVHGLLLGLVLNILIFSDLLGVCHNREQLLGSNGLLVATRITAPGTRKYQVNYQSPRFLSAVYRQCLCLFNDLDESLLGQSSNQWQIPEAHLPNSHSQKIIWKSFSRPWFSHVPNGDDEYVISHSSSCWA